MVKITVKINKQDKEILYSYSEVFNRIRSTKSLRGATRKDSRIISEIVNKYSEVKKYWNLSCNSCVYSLWLRASELYFNLEESKENEANDENKENGGKRTAKKRLTQKMASEARDRRAD